MIPAIIFIMAGLYGLNAQNTAPNSKPSTSQPNAVSNTAPTKTGDVVDRAFKGPKGETVYTDPQGKKYYYAPDHRKVYLDIKVDQSLKGPHGETVYIEPSGSKYYMNSKGVKTYINQDKKIDKPATDKKGSIKKADTQSPKK